VLFVVTRDGRALDDALREKIRDRLRREAGPRYAPAKIVRVDDLPRTRSGKLSELAARELIHGREPKNVEALANPESLAGFRDRAELRD
jgi:acetoacetyl-CoA synthetase